MIIPSMNTLNRHSLPQSSGVAKGLWSNDATEQDRHYAAPGVSPGRKHLDANPFPVSHFPPPMSPGHPLAGSPVSSTGDNEKRRITRHYYPEGDPTEIAEMMQFGNEYNMNPSPYVYAAANIYQVPDMKVPDIEHRNLVAGVPTVYQSNPNPDERVLWMADRTFGLTVGIGIASVILILLLFIKQKR